MSPTEDVWGKYPQYGSQYIYLLPRHAYTTVRTLKTYSLSLKMRRKLSKNFGEKDVKKVLVNIVLKFEETAR